MYIRVCRWIFGAEVHIREREEKLIVETKREEKRTCHASDGVYDVFDVV